MKITCLELKNIEISAESPAGQILGSFEVTLLLEDYGLTLDQVRMSDRADGDTDVTLPGLGFLSFADHNAGQAFFTAVTVAICEYRERLNQEVQAIKAELLAPIEERARIATAAIDQTSLAVN